jgi:hypothetical protein
MIIESKEVIHRPVEQVYKFVRDDLSMLVPYLSNVDKIEVKQRKRQQNKTLEVINIWYAKAEIPGVVKKFVRPEFFSWTDKALWCDETFKVTYQLDSYFANDLFEAKGLNSFVSKGPNETEFNLSCEIEIFPEKVPGLPKFLAKKISPIIYSLIESILSKNLKQLGRGINRYFEEKK